MIKNLFDNENAIFMGAKRSPDDCAIGIFGVNYDGTCSFKPGARFGPEAIRQVSSCLETYCPKLNKDLEDVMYVDFGSIIIDKNDSESVIESVKSATNFLINKSLSPIMIGGEHSSTTGAIEALVKKYPDLILVQLDATQSESPESFKNIHISILKTLKKIFKVSETMYSFVPIYPSGIWSWTFASEEVLNFSKQNYIETLRIEKGCEIWNSDFQNAAFKMMPNKILKELKS